MTKWSCMALLAISGGVQAHELPVRFDGCAVLHEIVYAEVTAAVWETWPVDVSPGGQRADVLVCGETSRTIRRAYAEAMQATGALARDNSLIEPRIDECLMGNVVECGPGFGPYVPLVLSADCRDAPSGEFWCRTGRPARVRSRRARPRWASQCRALQRGETTPYATIQSAVWPEP